MRSAAFNSRALNSEPMNGRGRYPAGVSLSPRWNVAVRMDAKTLEASYSIRVTAIAAAEFTWNEIGRVPAMAVSLRWVDTQHTKAIYAFRWHETGFVDFSARFGWLIHLNHHRSQTGRLTRHTITSKIGA